MKSNRLFFIYLLVFYAFGGYCSSNITHVVHILVDGLSAIYLKQGMVNNPEMFPNFYKFVNEGATTFNARCDYNYSDTLSNITTVITARPVLRDAFMPPTAAHGIDFNTYIPNITIHSYGDTNKGYISSVFDVIHDAGMVTGFFGVKDKLRVITDSYNELNGAEDLTGADNGRNKIDYVEIVPYGYLNGSALVQSFLQKMTDYHFNYVFLHVAELDYYGHGYGWGSETWFYYLTVIDMYLGWIFNLVENDAELVGKTAIILTADHGGGAPYNTHIYPEFELNYTIPLFVWGPGFASGTDLYDYFSNRVDPDRLRISYDYPYQPLRNGDSSNIAALLLGLDPIPNSWLIPIFGNPPILLKYEKRNNVVIFSWKTNASNFVLETTDSISNTPTWTPVNPDNILSAGTLYYFNYIPAKDEPSRFFRLRRLQ
jgi:hypothetical protein